MNQEQNKNNSSNQFNSNKQSRYLTNENTAEESSTLGSSSGGYGGKTSFRFEAADTDASEESLRRPRSQTYMDAINMIDMLSSNDEDIIERLKERVDEELLEEFEGMSTEEILEEIRLSIQEELETKEIPEENNLEGVISKCYIGGCYVHSISPDGNIIEHYTQHGHIPAVLAPGRSLYERIGGKCSCIEVYTNCCRIIATDGSVETVRNKEI